MTDYNDLPKVNSLYMENEQVNNAIGMIDGGGTMASFVIAPPATTSGEPTGVMMPASIMLPPGSASETLMAEIRAWLVTRSDAIMSELSNMGVTDPPPSKARERQ